MANVVSVAPKIGAEMRGIQLAERVASGVVEDISAQLDASGVVVLRNQEMTLGQFIAFSKLIGPLAIHPLQQFSKPGFPEVMVNSNIVEDGKPLGLADGGQSWHTDGAYLPTPHRATILYAIEVPVQDGVVLGDTMFASTSEAFEALDDDVKRRISPLRAMNFPNLARARAGKHLLTEAQRDQFNGVEHPVVRTHPRTGRKCVYVNGNMTQRISGMEEAESDGLLRFLFEHVVRPEFVYRHNWRVGDVVMWDNCSTQHCAVGDYALPQRRLIYRTVVKGAVPV